MTLRLSASILFLAVLAGYAQSTGNADGSADISPARMRLLLQGMGREFAETSPVAKSSDEKSSHARAFAFPFNGHMVMLRSHGKIIRLSACVGGNVAPVDVNDPRDIPPEVLAALLKKNQWNREHFSTGAYVDEQGCDALRADANFGARVTDEMIVQYVGEFLTDVTIYAKFITTLPQVPAGAGPAVRPTSPIGPMEWSQMGQNTKSVPPGPDAAGSVPGLLKINRNISLKYDPDRWRQTGVRNDGQWTLAHSFGEAHALVIAERVVVSRGSVEDVALANAQSVDPNAKIVYRAQRRINGADVRFLKIEAAINEVPTIYWGYFYGGDYGTVQVVTYTAITLLPKYEKDFTDFLNGLAITK